MSRFYASIEGQAKTIATRRGSEKSRINGHVRGWDVGVMVEGYVDENGNDCFEVWQTGGSNGHTSPKLIATVK